MNQNEEQVHEAIKYYEEKYGYLPTVREFADFLGLASTGSMHKILEGCPGIKRVRTGPSSRSVRWKIDE